MVQGPLEIKLIVLNMMSIRKLITLIVFANILSCSEKPKECNVKSKVLNLILMTDNFNVSLDDNDSEQLKLRKSAYAILNTYVSNVTDRAGGFKQSGEGLYSACMPLGRFKDSFSNFKKTKMGPIYEGLDLNNSPSNHLITLLNAYFYSPVAYFDEEYFEKNTLNQYIIDLCILQLEMILGENS